jgi:hypothetical protein
MSVVPFCLYQCAVAHARATQKGNVQSTQEIVELILDSNRNALLALDLKVTKTTAAPLFLNVAALHRFRSAPWE